MNDAEVLMFREEATAYVRSQVETEGWTQVNLSLRSDEAQLLTDLAKRLGWTKRRTLGVALRALDLMAKESLGREGAEYG